MTPGMIGGRELETSGEEDDPAELLKSAVSAA